MKTVETYDYYSDWLVDYLLNNGVDGFVFNPGASFRGLHDSLVAKEMEDGESYIHMVAHEEIAVATAHGYRKATGRNLCVVLHANVGLLHASMALFNAWSDRIPLLVLVGNGPLNAAERRPWIEAVHTSYDVLSPVREFAAMTSAQTDQWGTSQAVKRALTALTNDLLDGPALITLDSAVQEENFAPGGVASAASTIYTNLIGSALCAQQIAKQVCKARRPLLLLERSGRLDGIGEVLKEFTAATFGHLPIVELGFYENNFAGELGATFHRIEDLAIHDTAPDLIVAIMVSDVIGHLGTVFDRTQLKRATLVSVEDRFPRLKSWSEDATLENPGRMIVTDVAAFLTELAFQLRQVGMSGVDWLKTIVRQGTQVDTVVDAVLCVAAEYGKFVVVNGGSNTIDLAIRRSGQLNNSDQYLGMNGGAGLGYGLPASFGAALAVSRWQDAVTPIAFIGDGDFLYTPSALLTIAEKHIPVLLVVVNNRQYKNSVDHAARIAEYRDRTTDIFRATSFYDSVVDFVQMAASFGISGCRTSVKDRNLDHSIRSALTQVDEGHPFLLAVQID